MNRPSTILVVDGDRRARSLLSGFLRQDGHFVVDAPSAEEAISLVARRPPDLILIGVAFAGMTGFEATNLLKGDPQTACIPVIVMTTLSDQATRISALFAGAEDVLTTPIDRAELSLRVRNLLRLKSFGDLRRDHHAILEAHVQARAADRYQFRTAMDATADAIVVVNRTTMQLVEVNAATCEMLGYSRMELLEVGPTSLTRETQRELEISYDAIIADEGQPEFRETELVCKDGSRLLVEMHQHARRSGADWLIVAVARDITERKDAEMRLHQLAYYDALTGLPNRGLFYKTLERALQLANRQGLLIAILFIDVDHFKIINDKHGHAIGDEVLHEFASRLVSCVRVRDTVARLGGDEFAVILLMKSEDEGASLVASEIRKVMQTPFILSGLTITLTCSIGVTFHPDGRSDADTMLRNADAAMYRAKEAGRDTLCFFTAQMHREIQARQNLELALRQAIDNSEFVVFYQPKIHLESNRISGVEALLRWQRPGYGLISPTVFIAALEESGMIVEVGRWVIDQVCHQIGIWSRSATGPIRVSVNVAGRQWNEADVDEDVMNALGQSGIAAELLELEMTESALMENTERTVISLRNLRNLGVRISIDDFGTGYSSLAYLRRFDIDGLKIDISFIRGIGIHFDDAAIVLAIICMAHSLKLDVIAEGVETVEQMAYLRRHGCDQIQGYLFSPPVTASAFEEMVRAGSAILTCQIAAEEGLRTVVPTHVGSHEPRVLQSAALLN